MEKYPDAFGVCTLTDDGKFLVDGKEKFSNIQSANYMVYKWDTHVYLLTRRGTYTIYSLKEKKVLLKDFDDVIFKCRHYVAVSYGKEAKKRYYLHYFEDVEKNRNVLKVAGNYILENDGITLNNTKPSKAALFLPEKCKSIYMAKEPISFYALTENREILLLAPPPYNEVNLNPKQIKPVFWRLKKYISPKTLQNLKLTDLRNLILFKSYEEQKLFALISILYTFKEKREKVFLANLNKVLESKEISFREEKFRVILTLDKIILECKSERFEYFYDIFKYDDFYLKNLLKYNISQNKENVVRELATEKTQVKDILKRMVFFRNEEELKNTLLNLNCKPDSSNFYIINNDRLLVITDRKHIITSIKNALLKGKNFMAIINRYDLDQDVVKKLIKRYYPDDYDSLRLKFAFRNVTY